MWERLSRFDTMPGDIKVPPAAFYPTDPVPRMTRWTVRFATGADGEWVADFQWDTHVWALSSIDAVGRARLDFYGSWASYQDRQRWPIRVVAVLQEGV